MAFQPVTHVLFDMDGLLLNTEDLYTIAYHNVTSKYGKEYTYDIKLTLMGTHAVEAAKITIAKLDLPLSVDEFIAETRKHMEVLMPTAQLLPGAKKLIEHLHKHKIPIALATSSTIEGYKLKTDEKHEELFSLFPVKVFGSSDPEVKRGKPSPDIFLVAADRFLDKPQVEKCLVFEDAVNGVKAGKAAGMQVVMVPAPQMPRSLTTEATLVLNSLEEFKPELFGLPPFDE